MPKKYKKNIPKKSETRLTKWKKINVGFKYQIHHTCDIKQLKITVNNNTIIFLPKNILECIFKFLNYQDFNNVASVCKKFYLTMISNKIMNCMINSMRLSNISSILITPPAEYYRKCLNYNKDFIFLNKNKNYTLHDVFIKSYISYLVECISKK